MIRRILSIKHRDRILLTQESKRNEVCFVPTECQCRAQPFYFADKHETTGPGNPPRKACASSYRPRQLNKRLIDLQPIQARWRQRRLTSRCTRFALRACGRVSARKTIGVFAPFSPFPQSRQRRGEGRRAKKKENSTSGGLYGLAPPPFFPPPWPFLPNHPSFRLPS